MSDNNKNLPPGEPPLDQAEEQVQHHISPTDQYNNLYKNKLYQWWKSIRIPFWGKLVIMLFVVFIASIGYLRTIVFEHSDHEQAMQELDKQTMGDRKPAPDIEITTAQGEKKMLSTFKGKVVLLSFWASWCTPCLIELPTFKDLHNELHNEGLEIVPVNLDDDPALAKEFSAKFWSAEDLPFTNYFDAQKKSASTFEVDTLPANFIIDREGRIVIVAFGANDWSKGPTIDLIDSLIKER